MNFLGSPLNSLCLCFLVALLLSHQMAIFADLFAE